jgi:3-dehydroquinate synthase
MPRDLRLRYPGHPQRSLVRLTPGGLARLGAFVHATTGAGQVVLIADRRVDALHGAAARRSLRGAAIAHTTLRVPPGERSKSAAMLARCWDACAAAALGRDGAIVALGGGVVGDLAGFAAATWLRGVPWVGVPTTLLAQVDSAVGGKTAIDLAAGKNLAGAFHQPVGVLVDSTLLATLPARHRRAGLAEVVKIAFACDAALFAWCERHADALAAGDPAVLARAVERAVRLKARVVQADERERPDGPRTALNLGHTTAHALERVLGYRGLLHGEAVALGLRVAADLSVRAAGLAPEQRIRLEALLDHLGLPVRLPPVRVEALLAAMAHDKKRASGRVRWVLTPHGGAATVPRVLESALVRSALRGAGAR